MIITWIDDTIEDTPNGWYIVNYEVCDFNGTYFTHIKFDDKQEARAWIDEMTEELRRIL